MAKPDHGLLAAVLGAVVAGVPVGCTAPDVCEPGQAWVRPEGPTFPARVRRIEGLDIGRVSDAAPVYGPDGSLSSIVLAGTWGAATLSPDLRVLEQAKFRFTDGRVRSWEMFRLWDLDGDGVPECVTESRTAPPEVLAFRIDGEPLWSVDLPTSKPPFGGISGSLDLADNGGRVRSRVFTLKSEPGAYVVDAAGRIVGTLAWEKANSPDLCTQKIDFDGDGRLDMLFASGARVICRSADGRKLTEVDLQSVGSWIGGMHSIDLPGPSADVLRVNAVVTVHRELRRHNGEVQRGFIVSLPRDGADGHVRLRDEAETPFVRSSRSVPVRTADTGRPMRCGLIALSAAPWAGVVVVGDGGLALRVFDEHGMDAAPAPPEIDGPPMQWEGLRHEPVTMEAIRWNRHDLREFLLVSVGGSGWAVELVEHGSGAEPGPRKGPPCPAR